MTRPLDILGIGNAIVDILSTTDDKKLESLGLKKGSMSLIDEATANRLYQDTQNTTECSGGSAANTIAALASLGLSTGLVGKVRNDQLGDIFKHDLQSIGVEFSTAPSTDGASTARCLVYVTPDAQRTMATYLGACTRLTKADIDVSQIARAGVVYAEGYLWDGSDAIEALEFAFAEAKRAGKKTAFTLSDTFCVARHREAFLKLAGEVDILFANESEILALFETSYLEEALNEASRIGTCTAVTMSEKGSVVLTQNERVEVPTQPVAHLVDTTGAGDLFAAGFLYGQAKGLGLFESATIGNKTAGYIIQQLGARAQKPLIGLVNEAKAA